MRRARLIAVVFVGLLGAWLLWRQVLQRRRLPSQNSYAPEPALPTWVPAPKTGPVVKGPASTPERTHNESDALAQPQPPAAPIAWRTRTDLLDTDTEREQAAESDAESETAAESDAESETAASPADDLLRIEGIGPKISTIVVAAGITSFADLASQDVGQLQAILNESGIHTANPETWPEQAQLAAQGKWEALQELQDRIKNGRLEI